MYEFVNAGIKADLYILSTREVCKTRRVLKETLNQHIVHFIDLEAVQINSSSVKGIMYATELILEPTNEERMILLLNHYSLHSIWSLCLPEETLNLYMVHFIDLKAAHKTFSSVEGIMYATELILERKKEETHDSVIETLLFAFYLIATFTI